MKNLVKGLLLSGTVFALVSCSSTTSLLENGILTSNNHHQDSVSHDELPYVLGTQKYKATTWFPTNKANINAHGKKTLDNLVKNHQELAATGAINPNAAIHVIGHTDSRASANYNQGLSEKRASAVAAYLKTRGISTVVTKGAGEYQPVASNRTKSGKQKNRRAEIHIGGSYIRVVNR